MISSLNSKEKMLDSLLPMTQPAPKHCMSDISLASTRNDELKGHPTLGIVNTKKVLSLAWNRSRASRREALVSCAKSTSGEFSRTTFEASSKRDLQATVDLSSLLTTRRTQPKCFWYQSKFHLDNESTTSEAIEPRPAESEGSSPIHNQAAVSEIPPQASNIGFLNRRQREGRELRPVSPTNASRAVEAPAPKRSTRRQWLPWDDPFLAVRRRRRAGSNRLLEETALDKLCDTAAGSEVTGDLPEPIAACIAERQRRVLAEAREGAARRCALEQQLDASWLVPTLAEGGPTTKNRSGTGAVIDRQGWSRPRRVCA